MRSLPCAVVAILVATAPALADAVPDLDVERTCQSAQVTNTLDQREGQLRRCLRSEQAAKKEAERTGAATPRRPSGSARTSSRRGYPSYVEMVTCLELASGTVPTQSDGGGQAVGGPGSPRDVKAQREGGANHTKEPPASQRTNPMQVLDGK